MNSSQPDAPTRPHYLPAEFRVRGLPKDEWPSGFFACAAIQLISLSPTFSANKSHGKALYYAYCFEASSQASNRRKQPDGLVMGQMLATDEHMVVISSMPLPSLKRAKAALCELGVIHCHAPATGRRGDARRAPSIITLASFQRIREIRSNVSGGDVSKAPGDAIGGSEIFNSPLSHKERERGEDESLTATADATHGPRNGPASADGSRKARKGKKRNASTFNDADFILHERFAIKFNKWFYSNGRRLERDLESIRKDLSAIADHKLRKQYETEFGDWHANRTMLFGNQERFKIAKAVGDEHSMEFALIPYLNRCKELEDRFAPIYAKAVAGNDWTDELKAYASTVLDCRDVSAIKDDSLRSDFQRTLKGGINILATSHRSTFADTLDALSGVLEANYAAALLGDPDDTLGLRKKAAEAQPATA